MKLNKRVWWLIIPVLLVSYLLIFSGIYLFEKKSYLKHEQARLQLQISQFSALFEQYNNFIDVYYASLMNSDALQSVLKEKNERVRAFAIERNLSSVLSDLSSIKFNSLNLAIIDGKGNIKYFYEGGEDPFSEPNQLIPKIVADMFASKQVTRKKVLIKDDKTELMQARIVNPITMRRPLSGAWDDDAVAVILLFELTSFDQQRRLISETLGYEVKLSNVDSPHIATFENEEVQGHEQFSKMLWVAMHYDDNRIKYALRLLFFQMLLGVLVLMVFSSVLLVLLIERYITKPVQSLEEGIAAMNNNGGSFPMISDADDEISSLQRAFAKLYSQLKNSYELSKVQAETDSLTKLHNRRMFNESVDGLIRRADKNSRIALIYIDLDHFKFVNDNYGHKVGDVLLQEFASRLTAVVRLKDIVMGDDRDLARLAGDEFAVIVHDFDSEGVLNKIAERILAIFSAGFNCSAGHFPVTASIGIAVYPRDGDNATDLIVAADAAMYQAKDAGKNQCSYYSQQLADKARREQQIETELKKKDFSEFVLYYMPLIDAKTSQIIGVEALLRWFSAELGMVSPAEFIPIAESRGLFEDLDLWVFNRALDDLTDIKEVLDENGKLSINISSAQLSSNVFFYKLMQALQKKGGSTDSLELEITETFDAIMSTQVEANLNLFKQAGFSLALDDFGAGHTSLIQLMDYPIDVIKIDKTLIDRMEGEGLGLVVALISFCKRQNIFVTAEGVETVEQANILRDAGVDALQGFYFNKPMPLDKLLQKYSNGGKS